MCAARRPYRLFGLLFLDVFAFSRPPSALAIVSITRIICIRLHDVARPLSPQGGGDLSCKKKNLHWFRAWPPKDKKNPKNVKTVILPNTYRFFIHGKNFEISYDMDQTSESIIIKSPLLKFLLPLGDMNGPNFLAKLVVGCKCQMHTNWGSNILKKSINK